VTPHQDLVNAEAETDSVAAQLPTLGQQEAQLVNALSLLLGAPPDSLREELSTSQPTSRRYRVVPLGIPSELARRRPDIRAPRRSSKPRPLRLGIAVAQLYPSITLTGSFGLQALQFGNLGELERASIRLWSELDVCRCLKAANCGEPWNCARRATGGGDRLSEDRAAGLARCRQCPDRLQHGTGAPAAPDIARRSIAKKCCALPSNAIAAASILI
jgi:hypothetical protein